MDEGFVAFMIVCAVFGSIVAIVLGPGWLKSRERREVQETVRRAIDKGQELPPELIDAMTKDVASKLPSRTRDLRRGIIWLAVGLGLGAFSLINELTFGRAGWHGDDFPIGGGMLGIAAIPAVIGLAFIVLSFFNKNQD